MKKKKKVRRELHLKYRPKDLDEIIGQKAAVSRLKKLVARKKIPHAILLAGPTGCGKTTIGRIIAKKLHCSRQDFVEVNTADFRGIDMIREIRSLTWLRPMKGSTRFWLIDEAHQLTSVAQHAFLKILEEPPDYVYFCLATTEPFKLQATIRSRCTILKLTLLAQSELKELLNKICDSEKVVISNLVTKKIIEHSEGVARKAVVFLDSVIHLKDEVEQLKAIENPEAASQAIELARELIKPKASWKKINEILNTVEEEDETIRIIILSYARAVLAGGGKMMHRAYIIIEAFQEPFYNSHKAGMLAACYEVIYSGTNESC